QISSRGSQMRGEIKTKSRPLIDPMYGFESGQNKETVAANRKLAEHLKETSNFAYKTIGERVKTGLYHHPIIQAVVNAMWFANQRDEGPKHPEFFSPLPLRALALVLTVIENNIDEHITGIRTDVPFTANEYRKVYEAHIKALELYAAGTDKYQLMDKILRRLASVGRFHSGAQPLTTVTAPVFTDKTFEDAMQEYED
ncbi:hypothetical protein R3P38DRAFT_2417005, partial [Favolaschia claudopus]